MAIDSPNTTHAGSARGTALLAALLAIGATALIALVCVHATGGRLIYALDDAYIHLAMGRTLAESAVWGLNANTPGAASSSPLWTLLLAGMTRIFGAQTWLALALNLTAAGALALAADLWLREMSLRPVWRIVAVVAVIIIGPVGPLAMTGMEHVAHAAAVVLLLGLVLRRDPAGPIALALAAALATGLRYESAFVAAALALILALRHDWRRAIALLAGPTAVVVAVGTAQIAGGQGFLPNSLVVKAASISHAGLPEWVQWRIFNAIEHAFEAPVVALPLLAIVMPWAAASRLDDEDEAPLAARMAVQSAAALAVTMLLQITLASTGWYHRYEAYILVWATLSVFMSARAWQVIGGGIFPSGDLRPIAVLGLAGGSLLLLLGLGLRIQAWQTAPDACLDIATQHREIARFVERYYDGERLVLNDVGYVSYVSDGAILDLGGLASHKVAEARSAGEFDAAWVERAAEEHGAQIAINYDLPIIPGSWDRVASWDTGAIRVAGSDTVHFYALDSAMRDQLLANLREFEETLHRRVRVVYYSREGG